MLVDDEQAILDTLGALLSVKGFQVSTFDNGEAALNEFAKNPDQFDVIVSDMTMPKMTGDKLSMAALKIREDIPIIICTGIMKNLQNPKPLRQVSENMFKNLLWVENFLKSSGIYFTTSFMALKFRRAFAATFCLSRSLSDLYSTSPLLIHFRALFT